MIDIAELSFPYPAKPYPKLIINAAITGMVPTKGMTPHIPITVAEIVADAVACCDAGASMLHLHARGDDGLPTHRKEVYASIIQEIRQQRPDVIICASTSGRIVNTFEARSQVLSLQGDAKPDMASLTMGSLNFPKQASINSPEMIQRLAEEMNDNGIVPEVEIFDPGMLNATKVFLKRGILTGPLYCNLLLGSIFSSPGTLAELSALVGSLPSGAIWGAAGIGKYQLKMNLAGMLMGGHVRVGLEDNLYYSDGDRQLATNVMLLERIVRMASELGRAVATPLEARRMIGLDRENAEESSGLEGGQHNVARAR
jgi:uncharacterized protein (DUF849 family)